MMKTKSKEELLDHFDNFERYSSAEIRSAMEELEERGNNFTQTEQNFIELKIRKRIQDERVKGFMAFRFWEKDKMVDSNAPLLYSKASIVFFTVIFSSLFGTVLLSMNIRDRIEKLRVMVFGVTYTIIALAFVNIVSESISISRVFINMALNIVGAFVLVVVLWKEQLGEVRYRPRPIWKPLLISVIILVAIKLFIDFYLVFNEFPKQ